MRRIPGVHDQCRTTLTADASSMRRRCVGIAMAAVMRDAVALSAGCSMGYAHKGVAALALLALATPALAENAPQDVFDEFKTLDEGKWYVCKRPENEGVENNFQPDIPLPTGAAGLKLGIRPPPNAVMLAEKLHKSCMPQGAAGDHTERAEIWEQDCLYEKYGWEIWQKFSLFVDPLAEPAKDRLVIGQWKKGKPAVLSPCTGAVTASALPLPKPKKPSDDWGPSPFLALRFERREFSITIEQQDFSKQASSETDECRITLAVDEARPLNYLRVLQHGGVKAPNQTVLVRMQQAAGDPGAFVPDAAEAQASCMRGVEIKRFAALPKPFGQWVTLQIHFHIEGGLGAGGASGDLVEIWADGTMIATASGRIGTAPHANLTGALVTPQYFKFGPYRDPERWPLMAWIAHYSKAHREVDLR